MANVALCLVEEREREFLGALKKERMVHRRGAPEVDRTYPGIDGY
jgi:hypothetical protein